MKDIKISNLLNKLIESDKDQYDFSDIGLKKGGKLWNKSKNIEFRNDDKKNNLYTRQMQT